MDIEIQKRETLGIVGESGCGKSAFALSVMRLLPSPPGRIISGSVFFAGRDLLLLNDEEMRRVRGRDIAMIFQEPMTSLNPVLRVGDQIAEVTPSPPGIKQEGVSRPRRGNAASGGDFGSGKNVFGIIPIN